MGAPREHREAPRLNHNHQLTVKQQSPSKLRTSRWNKTNQRKRKRKRRLFWLQTAVHVHPCWHLLCLWCACFRAYAQRVCDTRRSGGSLVLRRTRRVSCLSVRWCSPSSEGDSKPFVRRLPLRPQNNLNSTLFSFLLPPTHSINSACLAHIPEKCRRLWWSVTGGDVELSFCLSMFYSAVVHFVHTAAHRLSALSLQLHRHVYEGFSFLMKDEDEIRTSPKIS